MIKKWSYVVAAAATVFGGSILTGCIDNDEPFGITQIRVETANLLKAKQALVSADAAWKLAQAELEKANAEIARINAEVAKAQAESQIKINELEAEAKAAKDKADAEKAQAEADKAKAETEYYIKQQQSELDKLIAQNEAAVKTSQLEYDKALYAWEMAKLKDQQNASSILYQQLANAYSGYLWALSEYNTKAQDLVEKQKESAQWNNNLVWSNGEWTHPQDAYAQGLKDAVKAQQTNIANTEKAIATGEARIADLENVETVGGVYDKWTALKAEVQENDAQIAELAVKFEETVRENEPLKQQVDALKAAWDKAEAAPIAIPAYTYKPTEEAKELGMDEEQVIVPKGVTYSLSDLTNYDNYKAAYDNAIENRKRYLLDQNDIAWTNARLNELKRQLAPAQEAFDEANEQWEMAKAVYNMGEEPDVSVLPEEEDLETAIEAYNATEEEFVALKEKLANARDEYNDANNAYWQAYNKYYYQGEILNQDWKDANDAYNQAVTDANEAYSTTANAARATRDAAVSNAWKTYRNAWDAYYRAQDEYNAVLNELNLNPDDKTLQANEQASKKKLDDAEKVANEAWGKYADAETKANQTCDRAIAAAETQRILAINKAKETLEKAEDAWVASGNDNAELQALDKARDEKNTAVNDVIAEINTLGDSTKELRNALEEVYYKQTDAINYWWPFNYACMPWAYRVDNYINNIVNGYNVDFPTASVPALYESNGVYENAKRYLIEKSTAAYGPLGRKNDNGEYDNGFNGPSHDNVTTIEYDQAFLIPGADITPEMMNTYIKNWYAHNNPTADELKDYQCVDYYTNFMAYGNLEQIKNTIKIAEASLKNSDLVETVVAELEAKKAELIATIDQPKKDAADAKAAYEKAQKQFEDLFTAITDEKAALEKENSMINKIIEAIQDQFYTLTDQTAWNASDKVDPAKLQETLKKANEALDVQKSNLEIYKAALEEAQKYLDLFNENPDNIYNFNPKTAEIEQLTAELKVAEDNLAVLKARVDELQAKYEAAAKQ